MRTAATNKHHDSRTKRAKRGDKVASGAVGRRLRFPFLL
jgi:hypothetical protein